MLKIKEQFFDRFDQTFKLFKGNFLSLFTVLFLYNIIALIITDLFLLTFVSSKISSIESIENFDMVTYISDPNFIITIIIGFLLFLIYLLLYIVVFLSILKTIKQIIDGEKINIITNIKYGFSNFLNSIKTYWYIFAYVQLIPAIIFIIGGLLVLSSISNQIDISIYIGIGITILSFILLIIFSIYRGFKASFALYSAVEGDLYEKENFNHSILITKNNWLRIFGNLLFISIIIGVCISTIQGTINLTLFSASGGMGVMFDGIIKAFSGSDVDNIKNLVIEHLQNTSIIYDIIGNTLSTILNTIGNIFIIIFTYIFYIRLFREYDYNKEEQNKISEL